MTLAYLFDALPTGPLVGIAGIVVHVIRSGRRKDVEHVEPGRAFHLRPGESIEDCRRRTYDELADDLNRSPLYWIMEAEEAEVHRWDQERARPIRPGVGQIVEPDGTSRLVALPVTQADSLTSKMRSLDEQMAKVSAAIRLMDVSPPVTKVDRWTTDNANAVSDAIASFKSGAVSFGQLNERLDKVFSAWETTGHGTRTRLADDRERRA